MSIRVEVEPPPLGHHLFDYETLICARCGARLRDVFDARGPKFPLLKCEPKAKP